MSCIGEGKNKKMEENDDFDGNNHADCRRNSSSSSSNNGDYHSKVDRGRKMLQQFRALKQYKISSQQTIKKLREQLEMANERIAAKEAQCHHVNTSLCNTNGNDCIDNANSNHHQPSNLVDNNFEPDEQTHQKQQIQQQQQQQQQYNIDSNDDEHNRNNDDVNEQKSLVTGVVVTTTSVAEGDSVPLLSLQQQEEYEKSIQEYEKSVEDLKGKVEQVERERNEVQLKLVKIQDEVEKEMQSIEEQLETSKWEIQTLQEQLSQVTAENSKKSRIIADKELEMNKLKMMLEDARKEASNARTAAMASAAALAKDKDQRDLLIQNLQKELAETQQSLIQFQQGCKADASTESGLEIMRLRLELQDAQEVLEERTSNFRWAEGRLKSELERTRNDLRALAEVGGSAAKRTAEETERLRKQLDWTTRELNRTRSLLPVPGENVNDNMQRRMRADLDEERRATEEAQAQVRSLQQQLQQKDVEFRNMIATARCDDFEKILDHHLPLLRQEEQMLSSLLDFCKISASMNNKSEE